MMWIADRQLREQFGIKSVYVFSTNGKCLSLSLDYFDLVFILLALENMFGNVQVNISIDFIF